MVARELPREAFIASVDRRDEGLVFVERALPAVADRERRVRRVREVQREAIEQVDEYGVVRRVPDRGVKPEVCREPLDVARRLERAVSPHESLELHEVAELAVRGGLGGGLALALTFIGIDGPSCTEPVVKPIQQRRAMLGWKDFRYALPAWLRGTAFGLPFGIVPAGGSEVPTFLAYGTEKTLAKRRGDKEFGTTGSLRGLAAPEAAGNATTGTAMGTLLALGLPVSSTAAIILAAFQQFGLQPGPLLLTNNADLVWTLLASLIIGPLVLLFINMSLAGVWAKLLSVPNHYLYAGITVLGLIMRRYRVPLAPVMIAGVLGPLAETELRRALAVSEGDVAVLWSSPFTIGLYLVLAAALVISGVQHLRHRRKAKLEAQTVAVRIPEHLDTK